MRFRSLGNSGLHASVVGLGTWVLGGGAVWGRDTDDAESIRAIHAALDAGVNLIDTAPAYGWGRSEDVVGKAIRGRRDKVILATKCGLWTDDDRGSFFTEFDGSTPGGVAGSSFGILSRNDEVENRKLRTGAPVGQASSLSRSSALHHRASVGGQLRWSCRCAGGGFPR